MDNQNIGSTYINMNEDLAKLAAGDNTFNTHDIIQFLLQNPGIISDDLRQQLISQINQNTGSVDNQIQSTNPYLSMLQQAIPTTQPVQSPRTYTDGSTLGVATENPTTFQGLVQELAKAYSGQSNLVSKPKEIDYQLDGTSYSDGVIRYADQSYRKGSADALPMASVPGGGILYSDGSIRKQAKSLSEFYQGGEAIGSAPGGNVLLKSSNPSDINVAKANTGYQWGDFNDFIKTVLGGSNDARVTGEFGANYNLPLEKINIGTDIAVNPSSTQPNVIFPFKGRVEKVLQDTGNAATNPYGNSYLVALPNGYKIRNSHLNNLGTYKEGDLLDPGAVLGQVGKTGNTTGPHLDYEVYDPKGQLVDARGFINSVISDPTFARDAFGYTGNVPVADKYGVLEGLQSKPSYVSKSVVNIPSAFYQQGVEQKNAALAAAKQPILTNMNGPIMSTPSPVQNTSAMMSVPSNQSNNSHPMSTPSPVQNTSAIMSTPSPVQNTSAMKSTPKPTAPQPIMSVPKQPTTTIQTSNSISSKPPSPPKSIASIPVKPSTPTFSNLINSAVSSIKKWFGF